MSRVNHEVVEMLDNLLKRTYDIYRGSSGAGGGGAAGGGPAGGEAGSASSMQRSVSLIGRLAIKMGCSEIDAHCGPGSTLSPEFVSQWQDVKSCLLRIAEASHHRGCPAGFGCLLRDCHRDGATALKFAEMMQVLSDLAYRCSDPQPFPLLVRYSSWMVGVEPHASRVYSLAEPSSLLSRKEQPGISFAMEEEEGADVALEALILKRGKLLSFAAATAAIAAVSVAAGIAAFKKEWLDTAVLWTFVVLLSLTNLLSTGPPLLASIALVSLAPLSGAVAILVTPPLICLHAACLSRIARCISAVVWIGCCVLRGFLKEYEPFLVAIACVPLITEGIVSAIFPVLLYEIKEILRERQRGKFYIPAIKQLIGSFDFAESLELLGFNQKVASDLLCVADNLRVLRMRADLPPEVQSKVAVVAECVRHLEGMCAAPQHGGTGCSEGYDDDDAPHRRDQQLLNPLQRERHLHSGQPQQQQQQTQQQQPPAPPAEGTGSVGSSGTPKAHADIISPAAISKRAPPPPPPRQISSDEIHVVMMGASGGGGAAAATANTQQAGESSAQGEAGTASDKQQQQQPVDFLTLDTLKKLYMTACGAEGAPFAMELAAVMRTDPEIRAILMQPSGSPSQEAIEGAIAKALSVLDAAGDVEYCWDDFSSLFDNVRRKPITIRSRSRSRARNWNMGGGGGGGVLSAPGSFCGQSVSSCQGDGVKRAAVAVDIAFGCVGKLKRVRAPTAGELDAHLGVIMVEAATEKGEVGNVLSWNHYMQSVCHLLPDEVVGLPFQTLVTTQRDMKAVSAAAAAAIAGESPEPFTLSFARGVGERVKFRVSAAPLFAGPAASGLSRKPHEELAGVLLLCSIVPPEKLESHTKLTVFGWFLDQLRRPLEATNRQVVQHRTALLAGPGVSKEENVVFANVMVEQTKRLLDITRQIKPLTLLTVFHHPMALQATFSKVVSDHEPLAMKKGVFIELVYDDDLPPLVYVDTEKLPEAVSYLVYHAIEHSYTDGTVTLSISGEHEDPNGVGSLVLSVKDNGTGIAEEKLKTIFQPGQLWDSERTGYHCEEGDWDLGLCNVKIVVEEMGGILTVASEVQVGSEFTISLPLVTGDGDVPDMEEEWGEKKRHTTGKQYSCLVMEKNRVLRNSICNYFWVSQYAVMLARTTSEVIDNLPRADVLLFSIQPGDIPAFNEIVKVASNYPDVEVILVIPTEMRARLPHGIQESIDVGHDRFHLLIKPFAIQDLSDVMTRIADRQKVKETFKQDLANIRRALSERSLPWTRGALLGCGTYGKVYEAKQKSGGVVAVKICSVTDNAQVKKIIKEISVMSMLQHPHIIHYFYCEKTGNELHLFMEYARGGSLAATIKECHPMALPQIVSYLSDIRSGLEFLHGKGVVHRDLKPANILLGETNECKIADFGCALATNSNFTPDFSTNGTVLYMAPEVLRGLEHDWRVDIWSFGCILMELISGDLPFKHIGGMMQVMKANLASEKDDPDVGDVDDVYRGNTNAHDVASICLRTVAENRPSAASLAGHPIFPVQTSMLWSEPDDSDDASANGSEHGPVHPSAAAQPALAPSCLGLLVKPTSYVTNKPPLPRNEDAMFPFYNPAAHATAGAAGSCSSTEGGSEEADGSSS